MSDQPKPPDETGGLKIEHITADKCVKGWEVVEGHSLVDRHIIRFTSNADVDVYLIMSAEDLSNLGKVMGVLYRDLKRIEGPARPSIIVPDA